MLLLRLLKATEDTEEKEDDVFLSSLCVLCGFDGATEKTTHFGAAKEGIIHPAGARAGVPLPDDLRRALRTFPDFPGKGILFQDIAPILRSPDLLSRAVEAMAEPFRGEAEVVAGIESRGFMLGAPVALRLGVPFVPIRKAGKLPGPTLREDYALEYAKATVEIQRDAFAPGARVLIVDDVLATGGTALAAAKLVKDAGAQVAGWSFLLEIAALGARERLGPKARVLVAV